MSYDKTRQVIEIDVTFKGWNNKLRMNKMLAAFLVEVNTAALDIQRLTIREVKK